MNSKMDQVLYYNTVSISVLKVVIFYCKEC
jgi:hypothetical protein